MICVLVWSSFCSICNHGIGEFLNRWRPTLDVSAIFLSSLDWNADFTFQNLQIKQTHDENVRPTGKAGGVTTRGMQQRRRAFGTAVGTNGATHSLSSHAGSSVSWTDSVIQSINTYIFLITGHIFGLYCLRGCEQFSPCVSRGSCLCFAC